MDSILWWEAFASQRPGRRKRTHSTPQLLESHDISAGIRGQEGNLDYCDVP
jgi:hypothetical protein